MAKARASEASLRTPAVDLDEAIAILNCSRPTFYRWMKAGQVKGTKVGRKWRFQRDALDAFLKGVEPELAVPPAMLTLADELAGKLREMKTREPQVPEGFPHLPMRTAMNLLRLGLALRASDLHIEPSIVDDRPVVSFRYRIDGALHTFAKSEAKILPSLMALLKRLGNCDVQQQEVPQDCRILLEFDSDSNAKLAADLRVCFLPTHCGEAATIRFLPRTPMTFSLEQMQYSPASIARIRQALASRSGLIFCTGPTGSGKTTLLYACLNELTTRPRKVISIEDPVEYTLPNVMQVQINPKANFTFSRAMRAVMRCDPDAIMIGEIRDAEVANLCALMAQTGHLVLTTMHTDDALRVLQRMNDFGVPPFMIGDMVRLIIAQRLVRALCPHCSKTGPLAPALLQRAKALAQVGGLSWESLPTNFRTSGGCARCGNTGFRGRLAVIEVFTMSTEIAAALHRAAPMTELRAIATGQGMISLAADAIRLAAAGKVSLEEVIHTIPSA